jgi:hypothetical protein
MTFRRKNKKKIKKNTLKKFLFTNNTIARRNTVAERLPGHPKLEGLSPAQGDGTKKLKMVKKYYQDYSILILE